VPIGWREVGGSKLNVLRDSIVWRGIGGAEGELDVGVL